jgi:quercetin dioxygenase-like cupin family protein
LPTLTVADTGTNPRRIWNPVPKDAATFVQTAEESGGARTLIDLEVAPGGVNSVHYHTTFDERFTVVSGEFGVQVGNEQFTLKPGETVVAPAMTLHRWYNASPETAMVQVELVAGNTGFERGLQIAYGLACDGLMRQDGTPKNIVHLALLIDLTNTGIPGFFGSIAPIMRIIAKHARRKGLEQQLIDRYCR